MAAAPQRIVPTVLVQTASSLPAADAGWTNQRWVRAVSGSEGSGAILGEWTLVQDYGQVKPQAAAVFIAAGVAPDINRAGLVDDLVGLVVRLLKSDDAGTITVDGDTYTAFWWGVIQSQTLQPDLANTIYTGGRATWLAVGLACVLDGIHLDRGWVAQGGGTAVDPGFLPPFNHLPGGDRSPSTVSVNGQSVYVHQLGDTASASPWTAEDVLALLLAGAGTPTLAGSSSAYGWSWSLFTADGCLDYEVEDLDLSGLTLLQAIDTLASTRRGIVWTVSVSGAVATVTVQSGSPDAITAGGYTLPASTNTATLDVTDAAVAPWLSGLVIEQDESSTYDVVKVVGSDPLTGLTLVYPDHLTKGWNAADEPAWLQYPSLPLHDRVWRRFALLDDWDETSDGVDGLNNTPQVGSGSATGVNGLTGVRIATAASDLIPGYRHAADAVLPCAEEFSSGAVGPRQNAVIVVYNGAGIYEDLSLKWRVEVHNEPLVITIDDGKNGTELATRLAASGAKLYVSLGMREHRPFAMSWQRDPGQFPRATPRIKLLQVQGCELWRVIEQTVTGVVAADKVRGAIGGSLTRVSGQITTRDDTTRLAALLALARAWYSVPAYRVRWTDRAVLDTDDTYAPGVLLTSVTLGDRTYGTYALITRRTWQLVVRDDVEMWDTVYETQRVLPDLEVIR